MSANKVFNLLRGQWHLRRQIAPHGTVEGRVCISEYQSNALLYREEGRYQLVSDRRILQIFREYLYCIDDNKVMIYCYESQTKSLLHALQIEIANHQETFQATAKHHCGFDLYLANFSFSKSEIQIKYHVSGPKKDYSIHTILTRCR